MAERQTLNGFAPGTYLGRCMTCQKQFEGAKLSYRCFECAASTAIETADKWKEVARLAGACMTCALRAPEPYGCSDCLNTGWNNGAPTGFADVKEFDTLRAAISYAIEADSDGEGIAWLRAWNEGDPAATRELEASRLTSKDGGL